MGLFAEIQLAMQFLMLLIVCVGFVSSHGTENAGGDLNHGSDKVNRFRQHASRDHVLEELEHQISTKKREEMTDQELQFHYFKLHDFDNNNLLDGLEIIKALTHAHDEATQTANEQGTGTEPPHLPPKQTEDELVKIIDDVLRDDDLNNDGFVSFYEFMADRGGGNTDAESAPAAAPVDAAAPAQ